jgi:hypothetical protein
MYLLELSNDADASGDGPARPDRSGSLPRSLKGPAVNPDLERLISADEEARTRLEAARSASRSQRETVAGELAAARQAQQHFLEQELAKDILDIEQAARENAAQRDAQRAAYRQERRRQAERLLPQAVATFLQIVRDGPAAKKP